MGRRRAGGIAEGRAVSRVHSAVHSARSRVLRARVFVGHGGILPCKDAAPEGGEMSGWGAGDAAEVEERDATDAIGAILGVAQEATSVCRSVP